MTNIPTELLNYLVEQKSKGGLANVSTSPYYISSLCLSWLKSLHNNDKSIGKEGLDNWKRLAKLHKGVAK